MHYEEIIIYCPSCHSKCLMKVGENGYGDFQELDGQSCSDCGEEFILDLWQEDENENYSDDEIIDRMGFHFIEYDDDGDEILLEEEDEDEEFDS